MKRSFLYFACLLVSLGALADTKISALPAGTTLAGTEPIPTVQSAATVATTPAAIKTYVQGTVTGTGNTVLSNSPTLVTPVLGTPSAINLTNATNLPPTALPAFSGDCTTPGGSGVLTCSIPVAHVTGLALIATSGSASDLSAGTLPAGRVPAQTGDTVSSAGSTLTTTQLLHPTDNTYTANHTVTATEEIITCNSSGALTMTLPAATGTLKHYWFKNINTGTCTIARAGSDTIDGATSVALSTQYNTAEVEDRVAGAWDRLAQPVMGGDSSGTPSNTTNLKLNGNTPGGTCTNQAVTSLSTSAVPSCTTLTSSYVDTSIAKTGTSNTFAAVNTTSLTGQTANTNVPGEAIKNATAAAASSQQIICYQLSGQGWQTTAVASQQTDWLMCDVPIQGTPLTHNLVFLSQVNGGGFTTEFTLTNSGSGTFVGSMTGGAIILNNTTVPANGFNRVATNSVGCYTNSTLRCQWDANGNFIEKQATADQSYSLQAPTTGFSITIGNNISTLALNPAGTLATGTVTMPATPIDGQIIQVTSSQVVTSLTVSANTGQTILGAPTSISPSAGFRYIYNLSGTTWYRVN